MFRKLIVVFAVLLLGVTAAAAQSCPEFIHKRQTLMKKSGEEAKIGTAMVKGERPFDAAKVQEIYAAFAEDAKQMPRCFLIARKPALRQPRLRRSGSEWTTLRRQSPNSPPTSRPHRTTPRTSML